MYCRYGSCFPYDTSTALHGIPCDDLYTQNSTYVYLSSLRTGGDFQRYLLFFEDTRIFFNFIPHNCIHEAREILCNYYLPPCGNETEFEAPTSVCEDVCKHLERLCPQVIQEINIFFKTNENILAPVGLTMINCSNTGDYLPPLSHCCTNLGIDTCKFLNLTKFSLSCA